MDKRTGKKSKTIIGPKYDRGVFGISLSSANAVIPDYPVFSLSHLMTGYSVNDCNKEQKAHFISKLAKMAHQTWDDLENSSHWSGAGFEKIAKESFKVSLPKIITEDVQKLYVMRFKEEYRMIGNRSDNVYYITHIELDKSAYNHGS